MRNDEIAAKGREIEEARWSLPDRYKITEAALALPREELKKKHPEMYDIIVQSEAKQKEWAQKANSPFGQMSPQEMERARSVTIAENLRRTLDEIQKMIGQALISGEGNLDQLQAASLAVRHQLAERLAIIGRFDLAAETEPQEEFRDHYLAILEAIYRNDDETCSCEPHRGSGEHSNIEVHQTFVQEEIWSLRHGQMCFVLKCNGCGFVNVVPEIPRHLQEQRTHRARAHQVAGKLSPEAAVAELTRRGHTFAKLVNQK